MNRISIALCADDYAQHKGIDQAIYSLLSQQRLSAVSCISNATNWPASAARLIEFQQIADFGLHFNLTEQVGVHTNDYSLSELITRAYLRQLDSDMIAQQFQRQCDAYEQHLKQAPAFIDGHQHVHQLPIIREIIQKIVTQRYGNHLPWIRNTVPNSIRFGKKALLLKLLGGASLKTQLTQAKIASNQGFSGVYDFNTLDYAALFENWLRRIQASGKSGNLIMCHPASHFPSHDKIGSARLREYAFFNSALFPQLLTRYQISIQPLSRILIDAKT